MDNEKEAGQWFLEFMLDNYSDKIKSVNWGHKMNFETDEEDNIKTADDTLTETRIHIELK